MLAHARDVPGFPAWLEPAAGRGPIGVDVFFVLSGFLITWLLLKEESRAGAISLRAFYARRALRILPPAYLFLAAASAWAWIHGRSPGTGVELASCFFFFRNLVFHGSKYLGHFWSLAIEEQFYLLWPAFLVFGRPSRRLPITFALVVVAPVWRFLNYRLFGVVEGDFMRPDLAYDGLLMGSLLALVRADAKQRRVLDRFTLAHGPVLATVLVASFVLLQVPLTLMSPNHGRIALSGSLAVVAVLIHLLVENRAGWVGRALESPSCVWLGRISYSLYLWQQPFLTRWNGSRVELAPQAIVLPIVIAALSYAFVEKPLQALRSRVRYFAAERSATSQGATAPLQ